MERCWERRAKRDQRKDDLKEASSSVTHHGASYSIDRRVRCIE